MGGGRCWGGWASSTLVCGKCFLSSWRSESKEGDRGGSLPGLRVRGLCRLVGVVVLRSRCRWAMSHGCDLLPFSGWSGSLTLVTWSWPFGGCRSWFSGLLGSVDGSDMVGHGWSSSRLLQFVDRGDVAVGPGCYSSSYSGDVVGGG